MRSTITLAMMAHNESTQITRVWNEIGHRLDAAVILIHPEYEDDSYDVAKLLFGHLPGLIEKREHPQPPSADNSRNEILALAKEFDTDYVLWLDPDSPAVGHIPDDLGSIPVYALLTVDRSSNISWWQPHLIHRSADPQWHGAIHEVLDCGQTPVTCLNTARIDRDGSGGGTERMLAHDLPLLQRLVAKNPKDVRSIYYLAQTYRDLGDYDNAIVWFKVRSLRYGWDQETFYAMYQVGLCYLLKGDLQQAEYWMLKAHAFRPSRSEPLERLVEIYQQADEFTTAIELLRNVHALPPTSDVHQVANRVIQ